jgi:hypothetical protein
MESSATPYAAIVVINGIEHGRGMGGSKKEAKSEAARKTLELLIPDFKKLLEAKNGYVTKETVDLSVSLFFSRNFFLGVAVKKISWDFPGIVKNDLIQFEKVILKHTKLSSHIE